MAPLSTGQKVAAAGRVGARLAGESRLLRGLASGAQAALGSFSRVLRILFLEVVGFLFIVIAVIGGFALVREYQAYAAGKIGPGKVAIAAVFTVCFGWFGVSSFWRAWKK